MPIGTTFANDCLKLYLQGTNISLLADNTATTPLTSLYFSLHTADPSAGTQATSEAAYTGYARVAAARTAGGFTITANAAALAAIITFGQRTDAASTTYTYWALGTLASGAGKVLFSAQITSPGGGIPVSQFTTPRLTPAASNTITLT